MIAVTSRKAIRNLTGRGKRSCAAHLRIILWRMSIGGGFSGRTEGVRKPPGAMNDIIEFHAALIPASARTTLYRKAPTRKSFLSAETRELQRSFFLSFYILRFDDRHIFRKFRAREKPSNVWTRRTLECFKFSYISYFSGF